MSSIEQTVLAFVREYFSELPGFRGASFCMINDPVRGSTLNISRGLNGSQIRPGGFFISVPVDRFFAAGYTIGEGLERLKDTILDEGKKQCGTWKFQAPPPRNYASTPGYNPFHRHATRHMRRRNLPKLPAWAFTPIFYVEAT